MYPRNDKGLKCFVDADFAGGWSTNESDNPASVYSRTGYMSKYKNCPILWASELQSEISFSTTEAGLSDSFVEYPPAKSASTKHSSPLLFL